MVKSMQSLHHLDLTTRFVHTTHITTLQALDTALARLHNNMTLLLSPHLTPSTTVNSTLTTCSRCMVRSMRSLHHLDLTTRFVHTTHVITLQALDTALTRVHNDVTLLLSPR